jgi:AcrR family transcriptional regulator
MTHQESLTESDVDDAPPLVDATLLRTPPTTARGQRTHAALVSAARRVFERDGYFEARLVDITTEAKISVGSFYTYFSSKEEVLHAVVDAAQNDLLHPGEPRLEEEDSSPEAIIRASNRAFLGAYKRNARLMLILEQLTAVDPMFREAQRRRSWAFARRNARSIEKLQIQGLADTDLDPLQTALALSEMVGRMAYRAFCLGDEMPMDELTDICTRLWINALQMKPEARER